VRGLGRVQRNGSIRRGVTTNALKVLQGGHRTTRTRAARTSVVWPGMDYAWPCRRAPACRCAASRRVGIRCMQGQRARASTRSSSAPARRRILEAVSPGDSPRKAPGEGRSKPKKRLAVKVWQPQRASSAAGAAHAAQNSPQNSENHTSLGILLARPRQLVRCHEETPRTAAQQGAASAVS
jgi:hypothetical protein